MTGDELKEKRIANGISIYALARKFSVNPTTILAHEKLDQLNEKQIEMYDKVLKDLPSVRRDLSPKESVLMRYPNAQVRTGKLYQDIVHFVFTEPGDNGKPITKIPLDQLNELIRPITVDEAWKEAADLLPQIIINSNYALRLRELDINPNLHNTEVVREIFPSSRNQALNDFLYKQKIKDKHIKKELSSMEKVLLKYPDAILSTNDFRTYVIRTYPDYSGKRLSTKDKNFSRSADIAWQDAEKSLIKVSKNAVRKIDLTIKPKKNKGKGPSL